ncbi:DUF6460 domain-containing protein [Beijerinckia indica]|uniref:DUF6460 domain-containing protein n=1 Tax=Beijerinckia indica subsp. indica (strain ATCC 9039 / DSM 1715 / NCIMB 8712) TaxID=395963 RepID=B2IIM0_BEII9|nr:DUF6460 domain-containing protein [Beijerinckia indica]ACB94713.1 hypothetical protein Bind_1070 [Beijerinckia indica subsp. indica ATCC 9039]
MSNPSSTDPSPPRWRFEQPKSTPLTRFLGGSPVTVFIRLLVLSLIVGAFLMWADIRPQDVWRTAIALFNHFWAMGFDAIRAISDYILAGAIIVIPVWLVIRLLSQRNGN